MFAPNSAFRAKIMVKWFLLTRKYAENIGVNAIQLDYKNKINRRSVTVYLIFGFYFMLTTCYLLFDAKTLQDYALAFFLWISVVMTFFGYLAQTVKLREIFQIIENMEKLADTCKYQMENSKPIKKIQTSIHYNSKQIHMIQFLKVYLSKQIHKLKHGLASYLQFSCAFSFH